MPIMVTLAVREQENGSAREAEHFFGRHAQTSQHDPAVALHVLERSSMDWNPFFDWS